MKKLRAPGWNNTIGTRRRSIAVMFLLCGVTGAVTSGAGSAADGLPIEDPLLSDLVTDFAEKNDLTMEDAALAFDLTKPLIDFIADHEQDPEFGSIWVDYDNGVTIHARTTGALAIDDALARLEEEIGLHIERHVAVEGSSWGDLHALSRTIGDSDLDVGYTINHRLGTFDVYYGRDQLSELDLVGINIRDIPAPDLDVELTAASAGDSVRYQISSWTPLCTAGMMYKGPGFKGFLTAAHCNDGYQYVYGSYTAQNTTLRLENCAPQDVQLKDFNASAPTPTNWLREPQPGYYIGVLHAMAGGYYIGQPGYGVGAYTNPPVGTLSVTGWGSWLVPGNGECAQSHRGYLQMSAMINQHDSGGPVALVYENKLHLASSFIAKSGYNALGSWLNWVSIPGGGHACTYTNPC